MYANGIAPLQRLDNMPVKLDECALVNDKTAINRGLYAGAKKVFGTRIRLSTSRD